LTISSTPRRRLPRGHRTDPFAAEGAGGGARDALHRSTAPFPGAPRRRLPSKRTRGGAIRATPAGLRPAPGSAETAGLPLGPSAVGNRDLDAGGNRSGLALIDGGTADGDDGTHVDPAGNAVESRRALRREGLDMAEPYKSHRRGQKPHHACPVDAGRDRRRLRTRRRRAALGRSHPLQPRRKGAGSDLRWRSRSPIRWRS
jgi:hypothetical protein